MNLIEPGTLWVGAALALLVGCTGDATPPPSTLIDGSPARPFPVALEGVDGEYVATRARVVPAGSPDVRSARATCASLDTPSGPVVERTGVSGASITFFSAARRGVHACDTTDPDWRRTESWCAHAYGRVAGTQPLDPRLSITCRDADGDSVGFAWVQPSSAAAYVVVRQPGYAEVYATSGMTPVRVTTVDVDVASSGATLAFSEHARDGTRIGSYEIEAQVTG